MPKEKQVQFRPEQLPPRAFEIAIVVAAIASAVIAGVWKAAG
ncbi:MAG: hypothetical protein ACO3KD_07175 [Gaiellales bacterium]